MTDQPKQEQEVKKMTDKEYTAQLGVACPNCNKTEGVEAWDTEIGLGCAWQNCKCTLCKATWDDQYTLTGYGNLTIAEETND